MRTSNPDFKNLFRFIVNARIFVTQSNLPQFCPSLPYLADCTTRAGCCIWQPQFKHAIVSSLNSTRLRIAHSQSAVAAKYLLCTSSCVTLYIASYTQRQLYHQTSRQERQRIPRVTINYTKFRSPVVFQ